MGMVCPLKYREPLVENQQEKLLCRKTTKKRRKNDEKGLIDYTEKFFCNARNGEKTTNARRSLLDEKERKKKDDKERSESRISALMGRKRGKVSLLLCYRQPWTIY